MPISRYPRQGHRIAPFTLHDVLEAKINDHVGEKSEFNNFRLCDLDESSWEKFSSNSCDKLAQAVVDQVRGRTCFPGLKDKRLPTIPEGIELELLELEVRTYNCLRKAIRRGYLGRLQNLSDMTVGQVMRMPNFGVRCLVDLLTSLESVNTNVTARARSGDLGKQRPREGQHHSVEDETNLFEPLVAKIGEEAQKLRKAFPANTIRCNDFRIKKDVDYLVRAANSLSDEAPLKIGSTIEDLLKRIVDRQKDPPNREEFVRRIQLLNTRLLALVLTPLEDEFTALAGSVGQGVRNTRIFERRLGFDGRGGTTLQKVADEFGMTRERIRQITDRFEARFQQWKIFTPALDRALTFVEAQIPGPAAQIEQGLTTAGITKGSFRLNGLLNAATLFGRKKPFILTTVGSTSFAMHDNETDFAKVIAHLARRAISRWGVATIADIAEQVRESTEKAVDLDFVAEVLKNSEKFVWLDQATGWFWLRSVQRNTVVNRIKKILSVAGEISISELRAGISRQHRMKGFAPPRRVLLELCRQSAGYRVNNAVVSADQPISWTEVLKGTERMLVEILKQHGPIIERNRFEHLCLGRGIKPVTFSNFLFSSPVIARFGPGVYGLAGANVAPGEIDSLLPLRSHSLHQVLKDYGWTSGGKLWLWFRLSSNMIASGVFTVPAGMKRFVSGEFKLKVDDGSIVGKLVCKENSGWGLGPFYTRRGGEPGDYLLVMFDLAGREAVVQIGDEALLEGVQAPSTN